MKIRKGFLIALFAVCILIVNGCVTYYIPVQSFQKQFQGINESNLRTVKVQGPGGYITEYKANPIETISCFDKNGNQFTIQK